MNTRTEHSVKCLQKFIFPGTSTTALRLLFKRRWTSQRVALPLVPMETARYNLFFFLFFKWEWNWTHFELYLDTSFMSLTNEEKWGLKEPIWPQSRVQMAGRWWHSRQCFVFQLLPYWIVLFNSVWREPRASSSYWQVAKAEEPELATARRLKTKDTKGRNTSSQSQWGLCVCASFFLRRHWSSW